jgi:hypothetical protein
VTAEMDAGCRARVWQVAVRELPGKGFTKGT